MAAVLEQEWRQPLEGLVIVPYGHRADCEFIEVIEAGHPVPDEAGTSGTKRIIDSVSGLTADDTVVCLLSGGGSALLSLPAPGISAAEKRSINQQLLKSGAAIHEINAVRKKLSAIKGGKLAAAASPASVLTLVISDVPGNDPSMVASGPTMADTGSPREALEIIDRFSISISDNVRNLIKESTAPHIDEADVRILATSDDALIAASVQATEQEVTPYSLGDVAGDARQLAAAHAQLAIDIANGRGPVEAPCVILSGGETTVAVRGSGKGGRNGEYALALALELQGHAGIYALAADTDGIDGAGNNAGCHVSPTTIERAKKAGVDPIVSRDNNDSYMFFAACGDLITTGPTRTNVNDFRAIYVDKR